MFTLNVTGHFAAAHKLVGYEGLCRNLHGHNWKVRLCVRCEQLDSIGMALDFGILKSKLNSLLDELDHQYLNDLPPFANCNPTSEHIARYIWGEMSQRLAGSPCTVVETEVWEAEKASVVYSQ